MLFLSPSAAAWGEADYPIMQAIAGNASDNYFYGTDYSAGVSAEGKFHAGRFRHYYFAEGSAVEFCQTYLDAEDAFYFMPEWYSSSNVFGAAKCYAQDGLTKEKVETEWETMRLKNVMFLCDMAAFVTDYYYWNEMGIAETKHSFTAASQATFEYYSYIPEQVDLDSTTKEYPLVMILHGSGMHPQAYAQNSAWPLVAKENDFAVIAIDGNQNDDDLAELITWYIDNKAIDGTKVYVTGFSMGSSKSWSLAGSHTTMFAAVGTCDFMGRAFDPPTAIIPLINLVGQNEFHNIVPDNSDDAKLAFEKLGIANGFSYTYDDSKADYWGCDFDSEKAIVAEGHLSTMNMHYIKSANGNVYTAMCDMTVVSHNVLPYASTELWKFFNQFTRNADGTISIEGVANVDAKDLVSAIAYADTFIASDAFTEAPQLCRHSGTKSSQQLRLCWQTICIPKMTATTP